MYYGVRRLEYDFLGFAFVPCFLPFPSFSFHYPGMFIFFLILRLCSSHLLSASTLYMFLVSFVPCLISKFLFFLYFFVVPVSRVSFWSCSRTRYVRHLICLLLNISRLWIFSVSLLSQNAYLSINRMEVSGRTRCNAESDVG